MKDTKIVAYLFFVLLLISCSTTSTTKCIPKETIYGTWVDTENNGVKITFDSLRKELVIDYSKSGGKVFKSNFQLNNKNQITSDILPLGAELIIDENHTLKLIR